MRTLAIIQARLRSSRLPNKVLAEINNRPLLWYVVRRTQLAALVDDVVVAIPEQDLEIAQWCAKWNVPCVTGPEEDVLERFRLVADLWQPAPTHIARITADCPLIDPEVIDAVLTLFRSRDAANVVYASNIFPERTFPDGLDVEAFPIETLNLLAQMAIEDRHREHVTSFLHEHAQFFVGTITGGAIRSARLRINLADARWTVDDAEDLEFVRAVYGYFECPWDASMDDIIRRCRPRVRLIEN
jgi:spore coat polysaccharide biosynthesis protein SpsF